MKTAHVLLSTYNGTPFLRPLLDSLRVQTYPQFTITIREDGSTDGTLSILEEYAADSRVRFYLGDHVGAPASYFELLARTEPGGFFAFCDQDDVWLPDKLARAAAWLDAQPAGLPALYCSRQIVVDAALTEIGVSRPLRRAPSFNNAIVENIAAGCTIVVNDAARTLLVDRQPCSGVMHDSWAYLVVAAFGRVLCDEQPGILYRQHAGNAISRQRRPWDRWQGRASRLWRRAYQSAMLRQAVEFDRLFGPDLDETNLRVLRRFIEHSHTRRSALAYAWRPDVQRQTAFDDAVLRVLIGLRYV